MPRITIYTIVFIFSLHCHAATFAEAQNICTDTRTSLTAQDESQTRSRVIVTLKETEAVQTARSLNGLGTPALRARQKLRVRALQDQVTGQIPNDHMTMIHRFSFTPAFAANLTQQGIEQLEQLDQVESVEPDNIVEVHTTQGLSLINTDEVRSVYSGSGVAIAILDTGIDYTHSALGASSSQDSFPNDKVIGGYDFGDEDDFPMDTNGHGTHCAGIAAGDAVTSGDYAGGVAPGAKLYALKITSGSSSSAYDSTIIKAIEWCITHQSDNSEYPIKVISISFGGGGYSSCDDQFRAYARTAANAVAQGIALFASSGNDGYCSSIAAPACLSDIISVGAVLDADIGKVGFCVDETSCAENMETYSSCDTGEKVAWLYSTAADMVAPYTNMSSDLDLLAPSHDATTTDLDNGYESDFGGTSAACPYAAGTAAVMQSAMQSAHDRFLSVAQVKARMISAGQSITYDAAGITTPRINLGNTDIDGDGTSAQEEIAKSGGIGNDADTDGDGVADISDNCPATANAGQTDSDDDGYGNACDCDIDGDDKGDGTVNYADYKVFKAAYGTSDQDDNWNPDADFNGDLTVNYADYKLFKARYGTSAPFE